MELRFGVLIIECNLLMEILRMGSSCNGLLYTGGQNVFYNVSFFFWDYWRFVHPDSLFRCL
jgi:hypothetical protein